MKTFFTLNTNPVKDIEYNINNIDLKLQHARSGHYYNQNLRKLLENNNKEERKDNINCEDCKISKFKKKKKTFNKTINKSTLLLQTVDIYIVGPLNPEPIIQ